MSFASSSSSSSASLQAASLAAQSSALVSDVLEFSTLSTASYPVAFAKFAEAISSQPLSWRSLPIIAFETIKDTSPLSATVRSTLGLFGHQYNIATVLLPDGRQTHLRADFFAVPPLGSSSRLGILIADDYDALTKDGQRLSRVAARSPATTCDGPTLDTLAALFSVADAQLGSRPYDVFGRNCFWMTDSLFYSVAKRFAAHWLAPSAELAPREPLERFLRGECGPLETAIACGTPDEAARFWAGVAGTVVRGIQMFFNPSGPHQFKSHRSELEEWIAAWNREMGRRRDKEISESCRMQ
ncbi:hypothetical protein BD414DRAFT_532503 [Trametes punicea]|nr:hypothetical protein BD414DRAFT_532503 [Trametes punicea]